MRQHSLSLVAGNLKVNDSMQVEAHYHTTWYFYSNSREKKKLPPRTNTAKTCGGADRPEGERYSPACPLAQRSIRAPWGPLQ